MTNKLFLLIFSLYNDKGTKYIFSHLLNKLKEGKSYRLAIYGIDDLPGETTRRRKLKSLQLVGIMSYFNLHSIYSWDFFFLRFPIYLALLPLLDRICSDHLNHRCLAHWTLLFSLDQFLCTSWTCAHVSAPIWMDSVSKEVSGCKRKNTVPIFVRRSS